MSIRITELDAINSLQDGDYVAVDNESTGTHKFKALNISANVAGNIANAYSSSASYAVGQYCLYNNNLYRCTTTISTPEAWNGAHWVQVTVGEGLYDKVDKVSGKALSANDFTNAYKTKLDGIEAGAEVNVQANWTESDSSKDDYIKNKPVNATQSTSGFMSATDKYKLDSIEAGAEVNVQANWTENDSSKDDYIKNKPTIDEALNLNSNNAVRNSAITAGINQVQSNLDTEITNRQNAVSGEQTARENAISAEQLARENADSALDGRLDTIEETLPNKANIDGSYDSMTVGNAEQLVSNIRINDKIPYLFRTSGGSADVGDREYVNGIVGGTVAWNQLMNHGNFDSTTGWQTSRGTLAVANNKGTYTVTEKNAGNGIYRNGIYVEDHIYFAGATLTPSKNTTSGFFFGGSVAVGMKSITANIANRVETIAKAVADTYGSCYVYCNRGSALEVNDTCIYENVIVIDLTQMFGSTIADYIYSLEQATAGAGVAWFKKLFNKPYYAYNAGELKSVSGLVSHDMTGFNQWDGTYTANKILQKDGTVSDRSTSENIFGITDYIPVLPNTSYYFKTKGFSSNNTGCCWYDADKNVVGGNGFNVSNTTEVGVITSPANAYYLRFTIYMADIATTCLNISWDGSRNGEYEPYELHSYPLDSDLTLRGIPKLDADNKLYYDGDTYESDGTVTRKYGIVDLGTLTWTKGTSNVEGRYRFVSSTISDLKTIDSFSVGNGRIASYVCTAGEQAYAYNVDKVFTISSSPLVVIYDSAYNDSTEAQFKTAMSGVYLVYELATPTTETADPYQQAQIVNDFGTEEYVIDSNTFAVPVGSDTDYPVNLVAKLEMSPNSPSGDGDYIVRQTDGMNSYVPLVIEDALPTIPSTVGTYKLIVTVASGSDPVLSWEAE